MNREADQTPSSDGALRELVQRYQVTWESRPEVAVVNGSAAPIGFVVELSAIADHAEDLSAPQCSSCSAMAASLERLARAALPSSPAPSGSSETIRVGRDRWQVDPTHDSRREMSAAITILHQGRVNRPVEEPQRNRVGHIVSRLRDLGAPERHWKTERDGG
jgi:hypothetical protein